MKWYEVAAAGTLCAAVLFLVVAGLGEQRWISRWRPAVSLENVTLVGPPTIHEHRPAGH